MVGFVLLSRSVQYLLMLEQQKVNRARAIGSLIGIAAILMVLAWKFLVH
jgi:hypothetical protein